MPGGETAAPNAHDTAFACHSADPFKHRVPPRPCQEIPAPNLVILSAGAIPQRGNAP